MDLKSLTSAETFESKRNGLCFTCDEKFSPNHISRIQQLKMMLVEEDSEVEGEANGKEEENIVWEASLKILHI